MTPPPEPTQGLAVDHDQLRKRAPKTFEDIGRELGNAVWQIADELNGIGGLAPGDADREMDQKFLEWLYPKIATQWGEGQMSTLGMAGDLAGTYADIGELLRQVERNVAKANLDTIDLTPIPTYRDFSDVANDR